MMETAKKEIISALGTSVRDLQQGIDTYCCLVAALMGEGVDARDQQSLLDRCPERTREVKLQNAIKEAIDVIEESRKAFKSKRLEALRKKLTQVLLE